MENLVIHGARMPSSLDNIGEVVDGFISALKKYYGSVSDCTIFELKVILNEVLINAVRHGNREDIAKLVSVSARMCGHGAVSITVEDEGGGYDYNNICSKRRPASDGTDSADLDESGRGILIVRSLCDKVKVNVKGNKITITKKLIQKPSQKIDL